MKSLKAECIDALLEAFDDPFKLKDFLDIRMNVRLAEITLAPNLRSMMQDVVNWAISVGREKELIDQAVECKPNPRLKAVALRMANGEKMPSSNGSEGIDGDSGSGGVAIAVDRKRAIQTLLCGLEERKDLFRFLNSTKELHEIMHELHRSRGRILATVHSRMNDPTQQLAEDVVESLQEWIDKAKVCCEESEFPQRPQDWIKRMETYLAVLTDSDPGRWEWALERLEGIPAREMSRLNDRLVDYAGRLRCEELAEYSQAILESFEGQRTVEMNDLMRRVDQFRTRCVQLASLVAVHDECQRIDELLAEAIGLPVVTADSLMAWPEVAERLKELKERCEGNRRLVCTYEASESFANARETAVAATEFASFREHFDDLFHTTDKELLKASNSIGTSVFGLATKLEALL